MKTKIGERIKSARQFLSITFKELTSKSGLKNNYLREIEQDNETPTMQEAERISKALGIRSGTFLDGEEDLVPSTSSLKDVKSKPAVNKEDDRNYLHFYNLANSKKNRHMDAYFVEIEPFSGRKTFSTHEGEEFLYIIEGSVLVIYGKKSYILHQGDTIYYDSIVPHFIGTATPNEGAKVLTLSYFPN